MKTIPPHVPAVARPKQVKVPPHAERRMRTGLRVLAVRRPSVPRAELRLRIPAGHAHDTGDAARSYLLPELLTGGTASRSSGDIARELQRLGATLQAAADDDDLVVSVGTLSASLPAVLDLLAEIVTAPSFPRDEVAVARDRVAQEIHIALSQPSILARQAMNARRFGRHRYARGLPHPDVVARVGAAAVRRYHTEHALPRGSSLVLVGDVQPEKVIERVEAAFAGWRGKAKAAVLAPPPAADAGQRALFVDKPGSVQTEILIAGDAVPRGDERYPALALAAMILGGYFSSRLFKNVREEKGYTYNVSSFVEHRRLASTAQIGTAVATEVTAAALAEVRYELMRLVTVAPPQAELDAARRFLTGVVALSTQTQAGLATYLDKLAAAGLDPSYLRTFPAALAEVGVEDVRAAAATFLAPARLLTVLVGDAKGAAPAVEALERLELATSG